MKYLKTRNIIILIGILLLGSVLRLWHITSNPIHLTQDEAALGYNAFSILKTGRDEYGKLLPLVFKSFGDYKPGLYIYLTIPWVWIFGLGELSVRLTSALSGIAAIGLIYLLCNEIYADKSYRHKIGLLAAFILSINPWHVHLSRAGWETNLNGSLALAGAYFLIKGLNARPRNFIFASLFFGLSFWAYQGAKLSTPIVILSIFLAFYQPMKKKLNSLIIPLIILLGFTVPILYSLSYGAGRLRVFSIFSYKRSEETISQILKEDGLTQADTDYYLYHSEPLSQFLAVLWRYFNHFSGKFLFFQGDWSNIRHGTPYHGVIYLVEGVFLVSAAVVWSKSNPGRDRFILYWLLLSPLPAALSRDSIQAVRALNMVFPLVITLAVGAYAFVNSINLLKRIRLPVFSGLLIVYLLVFARFLDLEFVHSPFFSAQDWYFGYREAVKTVIPIKDNYSQIIFNQSYAQPYIYFLFYQKYPPEKWWPQSQLLENKTGDVGLIEKMDNIVFRPLSWSGDKYQHRALVVGEPLSMDPNASSQTDVKLLSTINFPDGQTAFYIFESLNR
jgi:4-amino-4-deoxy-L-arabinose transferase-like glycosyltransferase